MISQPLRDRGVALQSPPQSGVDLVLVFLLARVCFVHNPSLLDAELAARRYSSMDTPFQGAQPPQQIRARIALREICFDTPMRCSAQAQRRPPAPTRLR
jgi:hypothetical protein